MLKISWDSWSRSPRERHSSYSRRTLKPPPPMRRTSAQNSPTTLTTSATSISSSHALTGMLPKTYLKLSRRRCAPRNLRQSECMASTISCCIITSIKGSSDMSSQSTDMKHLTEQKEKAEFKRYTFMRKHLKHPLFKLSSIHFLYRFIHQGVLGFWGDRKSVV
jgi:hypothetical protein